MGTLLKFKNGQVAEYKGDVSLLFTGDIRDLSLLNLKTVPQKIVVSRNDDRASIYKITAGKK